MNTGLYITGTRSERFGAGGRYQNALWRRLPPPAKMRRLVPYRTASLRNQNIPQFLLSNTPRTLVTATDSPHVAANESNHRTVYGVLDLSRHSSWHSISAIPLFLTTVTRAPGRRADDERCTAA